MKYNLLNAFVHKVKKEDKINYIEIKLFLDSGKTLAQWSTHKEIKNHKKMYMKIKGKQMDHVLDLTDIN